jgi:hypothetical protein
MIEGISEALHAELAPLGIHVTIIEPGPFRTDFLDASSLGRAKAVIPDYAKTSGSAREWADDSHNAQPGDPAKAAAAMVRIAAEVPPHFDCSWGPIAWQRSGRNSSRSRTNLRSGESLLSRWPMTNDTSSLCAATGQAT